MLYAKKVVWFGYKHFSSVFGEAIQGVVFAWLWAMAVLAVVV